MEGKNTFGFCFQTHKNTVLAVSLLIFRQMKKDRARNALWASTNIPGLPSQQLGFVLVMQPY